MSPHDHQSWTSAAAEEHRTFGPAHVRFALVTVSDTRGEPDRDAGGKLAKQLLEREGHNVAHREFVPDDAPTIRAKVEELLGRADVEAVLLTGGTGASPRDVTPEAVRPLLEKELPGFGEVFRVLSFEEIGAPAYLSRALCGIARGKPVWALPGSPAGVALAVERLVAPEAGHLVGVARGRPPGNGSGGSAERRSSG